MQSTLVHVPVQQRATLTPCVQCRACCESCAEVGRATLTASSSDNGACRAGCTGRQRKRRGDVHAQVASGANRGNYLKKAGGKCAAQSDQGDCAGQDRCTAVELTCWPGYLTSDAGQQGQRRSRAKRCGSAECSCSIAMCLCSLPQVSAQPLLQLRPAAVQPRLHHIHAHNCDGGQTAGPSAPQRPGATWGSRSKGQRVGHRGLAATTEAWLRRQRQLAL